MIIFYYWTCLQLELVLLVSLFHSLIENKNAFFFYLMNLCYMMSQTSTHNYWTLLGNQLLRSTPCPGWSAQDRPNLNGSYRSTRSSNADICYTVKLARSWFCFRPGYTAYTQIGWETSYLLSWLPVLVLCILASCLSVCSSSNPLPIPESRL